MYDDNKYNINHKTQIETGILTDSEIIEDLQNIITLLKNKKLIFVGHLVSREYGDRFDLLCLVKSYCEDNNLLFIDPIFELKQTNVNINELIQEDGSFTHYNKRGHDEILKVYEKYINKLV